MGKIVTKKVNATISALKLMKYGRQSSMRGVYDNKPELKKETPKKKETVKEEIKEEIPNVMNMDTKQKIELANEVLAEEAQIKAKRIKKDKGLIERKENTIILTEDNRELLND